MKSIGITLRYSRLGFGKSNEDNSIQLHMNLWKRPPNKSEAYPPFILDIGIMARFNVIGIKIYLPFNLDEENHLIDLAHILTGQPSILCALFNDDYEIKPAQEGFIPVRLHNAEETQISQTPPIDECCLCKNLKKIKDNIRGKSLEKTTNTYSASSDTPKSFFVYALKDNDLSINNYNTQNEGGSIFKISVPTKEGCDSSDYYYIRFRVVLKDFDGLAYEANLSNDWIQSAFTKLDMYNIQINEQRDIPDIIKNHLLADYHNFACFSKINILYISNPEVKVENGSSVKSDSRLIEPSKWEPYIPDGYKSDIHVAHHWRKTIKEQLSINKDNLFFTASYPKFQLGKLFSYASVVVGLGCIGSILASLICWLFPLCLTPTSAFSPSIPGIPISIILYLVWMVLWYLNH